MITVVTQAIRNHKSNAPCCYMPGTDEHALYWKTMQSIKDGHLVVDKDSH